MTSKRPEKEDPDDNRITVRRLRAASGLCVDCHDGSQVELIRSQPVTRDKFPAVVLVFAYLFSEANAPEDEAACVQPVDPFVENAFYNKVKELEAVLLSASITNYSKLG